MSRLTLEARPRTVTGKGVKVLRRQGQLPANVYGHNVASQSLEIDARAFALLQRHLSASSIVDLKVDGSVRPVMIHHVQHHFSGGQSTHVELFAVNMLEKLTASVPLNVVDVPEAVQKNEDLLVLQELDSLEVSCLPGDLPESIEVSAAGLAQTGDTIHVRDLKVDRTKIEIRANDDDRVVSLAAVQRRAEDEEPVAEVAEAPATGEVETKSEA
jgi:large subunit ribosomal protein L25